MSFEHWYRLPGSNGRVPWLATASVHLPSGRGPWPVHSGGIVLIINHRGDGNHVQNKNNPSGLQGAARRFVKFNGGVSEAQLAWLRQTLAEAVAQQQRALVCCHLALHPGGYLAFGLLPHQHW